MNKEEKTIWCCICGELIKGMGNNPNGAAWKDFRGNVITPVYNNNARCCDKCNKTYVLPGRLYKLFGGDK